MVKRIGTSRRKTRHLFRKNYRSRGKLSVVRYLQEFSIGDKVALTLEPSVHEGMYFRRFHGRIGTVIAMKLRFVMVKRKKLLLRTQCI